MGVALSFSGAAAIIGITAAVILTRGPEHAPPPIPAIAITGATALSLVAGGLWMIAFFRPLPKHLLRSGVSTPAVVLLADTVGPEITIGGLGRPKGSVKRHRYRLEVRPPDGAAYEVEIRTFDGPSMLALNSPMTVYVAPRKPNIVCPDWSTLPEST